MSEPAQTQEQAGASVGLHEQSRSRRPWFLRTRTALVGTLALALLAPIAAVAVVSSQIVSDHLREDAIEDCEATASIGARVVHAFLTDATSRVEACARGNPTIQAAQIRDKAALRNILGSLVRDNPQFERAFVVDPAGVEYADWPSDPDVLGVNFAHRDWYRGTAGSQASYVSEIYRRTASPRILLAAVATPIRDETGGVLGYLVGQVPLQRLANWTTEVASLPERSLRIVDQSGFVIGPAASASTHAGPRPGHPAVQRVLQREPSAWIGDDPLSGVESVLATRGVEPHGWQVMAQLPTSSVFAPLRTLRYACFVLALLLFGILLTLALHVFRSVRSNHRELLALQESKDRLAMTIVHDLRNPLVAILGNLDLASMKLASEPEIVEHCMRQAQRSSERLRAMITTIIDVVRMEDGHMPISSALCDLGPIVRAIVEEYRPRATVSGIALTVEVPAEPVSALVDQDVMVRVVENLLSNALKHTPGDGEVRVALRPAQGTAPPRLTVSDTGEGLAPEDVQRLFRRYGRVSGQARGTRFDTGLGLVFCRLAIEAQGGSIRALSEVGRGTTFVIDLPPPAQG